ncbi:DsbA family oxidoreductase [Streptomyces roseicoloratus]|uniref:DsbA family oxidoreductase n=1 Tax=Streptomyces roseicoloratus TaxID=2508722 RepID=A0ABY9RUQ3_9ACTN|nr:DsbA family oxidoreductase [Streptomyces roseicoloratus]WMX45710.1 DsbA family oxidoreductase [Streptomyces roseicoloratus]
MTDPTTTGPTMTDPTTTGPTMTGATTTGAKTTGPATPGPATPGPAANDRATDHQATNDPAKDDRAVSSAPVKIRIWSDYVCPFCMLAEGPLEEAVEGLGVDVEIEWKPFELRPHPHPTLRPEDEYLPAIWQRAVYPMARRMGVDITLPTVSPQPYTRLAFEGYQYAAEQGKGAAYTARMFRAFFQEDLDLGQVDVVVRLAEEIGLDGETLRKALDDGTYTAAHQDALREAAAHSIRSVPTLLVGDTRIEGVPSVPQLRKAILDAQAAQAEQEAVQGAACSVDGGC